MLVTNHVLSGAIAGSVLPGPGAAWTVGVASHFALDMVPHWGDVTFEEMIPVAVRDGLLGLAAMALLTAAARPDRRVSVLAGMAGAAFPDLDKPATYFFGRSCFPRWLDRWHGAIQRESSARMTQEFAVGTGFLVAALALARASRH